MLLLLNIKPKAEIILYPTGAYFQKLTKSNLKSSENGHGRRCCFSVFSCRHSYHLDCLERNESWEETFVEVDGLPERKIVHFCIICKSRTDPNFESRRSFPPKSAASFHSEDNRSNFTFSRQKSSSHSFSQVSRNRCSNR